MGYRDTYNTDSNVGYLHLHLEARRSTLRRARLAMSGASLKFWPTMATEVDRIWKYTGVMADFGSGHCFYLVVAHHRGSKRVTR